MRLTDLQSIEWREDFITRRYVAEHKDELADIAGMTPAQLAEACTYCRTIENPFALELVSRSGNSREFAWAVDEREKGKVLRACAASFGIKLV